MYQEKNANCQSNLKKNENKRTLFKIPITGCLEIIILLALCGIFINECQRSKIRRKIDKARYEYIMDSINQQRRQL